MNKKVTSIVSYITWIGWLIAFLAGAKEEAKFYLNQSLVIVIAQFALAILHRIFRHGVIATACNIVGLLVFILWVIGIYHAIKQDDVAIPVVGDIQILK